MNLRRTPTVPLAEVRVRVPAKINLSLRVGPLADDGYHPLATVFHAVSLLDEVVARRRGQPGIQLEHKGEGADLLPTDDRNLAVQAAKLLIDRFDLDEGVELEIRKQIPVAGGMAGGSADGAAALLACSMLWDLDTDPAELHDLAAELGSDVPFALTGGNALGTGRGTELVPLLSRGSYHWVLAMAHEGLSTPAVFRRFDELGSADGVDEIAVEQALLNALAVGDVQQVARHLRNDLQPAAVDLRPELGEVLEYGVEAGALASVLSGSGPTCAFLCASETVAMDVAASLSGHREVRQVRRAKGRCRGLVRPREAPCPATCQTVCREVPVHNERARDERGRGQLTPQRELDDAACDEVDALVAAWNRERPDLATEPMNIWSRIKRLEQYLDAARRHSYAEHDIDVHEFDVLAALRRAGSPYQLSPGQLTAATHVTSGTMTHRIDRLVRRGFVERGNHPDDGRAVLVRLTAQGREVVDAALSSLLAAEEALLSSLPAERRARLADDLRALLRLQ